MVLSNNTSVWSTNFGLAVCSDVPIVGNREVGDGQGIAEVLPIFIAQLVAANLTYRLFFYITRPLHMPDIVSQILCGLALGPSVLGEHMIFQKYVFPYKFMTVLETFANIAMVLYMFLVGIEMDVNIALEAEIKSFSMAAVGILVPACVGIGMYVSLKDDDLLRMTAEQTMVKNAAGYMFWALILMNTNFPDLARILSDLKLLRSDMGQIAMCASIITDFFTWIFLAMTFAIYDRQGHISSTATYVVISTMAFFAICVFILRPAIHWIIEQTTKEGEVTDNHIWFVLSGAMLCGLITDICGVHSVIGAILFGAIMPKTKAFRQALVEKLEYLIVGFLMPLVFIVNGLRSDLTFVMEGISSKILVMIIIGSCLAKVFSTFVVSMLHGIPKRDGLALGFLMNTKGMLTLLVLNSAREVRALDSRMFTIMVLAVLIMSMLVQPILALTYKPKKQSIYYKQRTIRELRSDEEFRILVCVHNPHNAYGIMKLLQASDTMEESAQRITIAHMVELTGRTTASVLVMNEDSSSKGSSLLSQVGQESQQIANIFNTIRDENPRAMVQNVTLVSPYRTMHEDIRNLAEDKAVCFIILPYHKHLTTELRMSEGDDAHANINSNLLNNTPCSLGILVDRGISRTRSQERSHDFLNKQVVMLFIGGADDREAMAYSLWITKDQMVNLIVMRFLPGQKAMAASFIQGDKKEYEREKQRDDECIYEFKFKTLDNPSVSYLERVVNDGHETITEIKALEEIMPHDLYIIGRGKGVESPVTTGLTDWDPNLNLGSIGDTLASSSFMINSSILVIQQYVADQNHKKGSKKGDLDDFKPFAQVEDIYDD